MADLVERCCELARRVADALSATEGVCVLNDVVLNQVLVRFADDDDVTRRVVAAVQRDGTCWMGGATWRGMQVMRISVTNWSTDANDVDRSIEAILRCFASVREAPSSATKPSLNAGRPATT
jgi:glutamate/tyrosine decarboxylase-like PLP-dependent enzyme